VGRAAANFFRSSFKKFRMSGIGISTVIPAQAGIPKSLMSNRPVFGNTVRDSRLRGNDGGVDVGRTVTEPPSPYRYRVRRMVFLQVADQVRLCRARARYWFWLVECCSLS